MKKIIILLFVSTFMFSCKKEELKKVETQKPVVKKDTITAVKKEEPKAPSLIFTVQVGAYKNENSNLSKVTNVQIAKEANLYKYRLGTFRTYQEARKYRAKSITTYPDAFVQALKDGSPIPIQQALNSQ